MYMYAIKNALAFSKGAKTRRQQSSILLKEGTILFPSPEQHLFETKTNFTGIKRADSSGLFSAKLD